MFYVILSTLINFISIENYIAAKSTVCYMRDWLQFSVADVLPSIRAQPDDSILSCVSSTSKNDAQDVWQWVAVHFE